MTSIGTRDKVSMSVFVAGITMTVLAVYLDELALVFSGSLFLTLAFIYALSRDRYVWIEILAAATALIILTFGQTFGGTI